jgi:hypothetical protein
MALHESIKPLKIEQKLIIMLIWLWGKNMMPI